MVTPRLITALGAATAVLASPSAALAATQAATPYVVTLKPGPASSERVTAQLEKDIRFAAAQRFGSAVRGFAATLSDAQVERLRRSGVVDQISVDAAVRLTAKTHAEAPETTPVGIARVGGIAESSQGSSDAAVAVIDTGVDLGNPDLDVRPGVNCVKPDKAPQDDNGHGTHVAGTIAARNGGGDSVGVAPGTTVYSVKVLDHRASGRISGLLCGIDWVHANAERLNIKVANISITASGTDDGDCGATDGSALHRAICSSVAAGLLYVAAAGNAGVDLATTAPASFGEVLTVTAVTDTDGVPGASGGQADCDAAEWDDRAATYSNYASSPAAAEHLLAAPGTCVVSSAVRSGLATMTGTSMAAPHVTGAALRCLSTAGAPGPCAGKSPAQIIAELRGRARRSADDFGFDGDPLSPIDGRERGFLVSTHSL